MAQNRFCDGVKRRDFLKVGVLGGLGLSLADFLQRAQAGEAQQAKAKSAIYIRLGGGPTHLDTFDMKPDAPSEYRGNLKPIATNMPGMQICEQLPLLAQCADKFTILRGVSHTLAAHELGTSYMITGNRPIPSLAFPGFGAVVSKELPAAADMPPFIAVPDTPQTGGYLGLQYGPFATNARPKLGQPYQVRGIALNNNLTAARALRREKLLDRVDRAFQGFEQKIDVLNGLDQFSQQAYDMISSKTARNAFDMSQENPETVKRFGDGELGQSCLLACRLVEAGTRFVTITTGGWDMHQGIFDRLSKNLPGLDQGLSALLTTLSERGLLDTTSIIVTGEFGRTPKINKNGGRDHWPRAMFVLLAGGGMKTGQVIGASDAKGEGPSGEAITPDDVAASLYHSLGIDYHKEYHTDTGRPVMIVRNGNIIPGLFG
jgi:hypothetical protein